MEETNKKKCLLCQDLVSTKTGKYCDKHSKKRRHIVIQTSKHKVINKQRVHSVPGRATDHSRFR